MKAVRTLFDFSPDSSSPLVPGFCWFGGGGSRGNTYVAPPPPPPAAPAPAAATAPTQSVTHLLAGRNSRRGRASTILSTEDSYATTSGRRTLLGVPIVS